MEIDWDNLDISQIRMIAGDIMGNVEPRIQQIGILLEDGEVPRDMISALALFALVAQLMASRAGEAGLAPSLHIFSQLYVSAMKLAREEAAAEPPATPFEGDE